MIEIVNLYTSRDEYDITKAAERSMTVRELIDELENYSDDAKIVFNNDNGYTYGIICGESLESDFYETREEKERRETLEAIDSELEDLEYEYAHPDEDDEPMSDEQYYKERRAIFKSYNMTEEEYNSYK